MFYLTLFAAAWSAQTPDIAGIVQGNWLCTVEDVTPNETTSSAYYLRVNGSKQDGFIVQAYENNESSESIDQFHVTIVEKTSLQFGRDSETLQSVNFTAALGPHYSATGVWDGAHFSAVIARSSVLTITIVNGSRHSVIYLEKDIDRTPPPWYKKYLSYGLLGLAFVASQGFSMWSQRKLAAQTAAPPARRDAEPDGAKDDAAAEENTADAEEKEKTD